MTSRDWVDCPVCGEPDMRLEDGVITCTNLSCASNGGSNHNNLTQATKLCKHECMKEEWKGKCCCTCFWHWPDYGHPYTNGGRVTEQRGWVCANPELFDGARSVISGWGEHGFESHCGPFNMLIVMLS